LAPKIKNIFKICAFTIFIIFSFVTTAATAQNKISGRILFEKDNRPAAYVSVGFMLHKQGTISDKDGYFTLPVSGIKKKDSLQISLVGYKNIRIPVASALTINEFKLAQFIENMEDIKVTSTVHTIGAATENFAYLRSWNTDSTSGEIGRIFSVESPIYNLEKVRFKVTNRCQQCLVRLHIRKVKNNYPAEEIVTDSIAMYVKYMDMESSAQEFELTDYHIQLKEKEIYVGLEVAGCDNSNLNCSFCFVGAEQGGYIYKSTGRGDWENFDYYNIYMKLFLKY